MSYKSLSVLLAALIFAPACGTAQYGASDVQNHEEGEAPAARIHDLLVGFTGAISVSQVTPGVESRLYRIELQSSLPMTELLAQWKSLDIVEFAEENGIVSAQSGGSEGALVSRDMLVQFKAPVKIQTISISEDNSLRIEATSALSTEEMIAQWQALRGTVRYAEANGIVHAAEALSHDLLIGFNGAINFSQVTPEVEPRLYRIVLKTDQEMSELLAQWSSLDIVEFAEEDNVVSTRTEGSADAVASRNMLVQFKAPVKIQRISNFDDNSLRIEAMSTLWTDELIAQWKGLSTVRYVEANGIVHTRPSATVSN